MAPLSQALRMHETSKPLGPALTRLGKTIRLCLSPQPSPSPRNEHSRRQVWLQQVLSLETGRSSAAGGAGSGGTEQR